MSVDAVHHTVIAKVILSSPEMQLFYNTLYPGQGNAFGMTSDFSGIRRRTPASSRWILLHGGSRVFP
jgi:hypothetical protein